MRGIPVGEEVPMGAEGEKVAKRSVAVDDTGRRILVRAGDPVPDGFEVEGEAPQLAATPAPVQPDEPDDDDESKVVSTASTKAKPKPADKGA